METSTAAKPFHEILLVGQGRSSAGIAMCLALSGTKVDLASKQMEVDQRRIDLLKQDFFRRNKKEISGRIEVKNEIQRTKTHPLVIISGYSELPEIASIIHNLESNRKSDRIIAIATDHIHVSDLQKDTHYPENIMVVNWSEPAHTTFFLEIVHNKVTDPKRITMVRDTAQKQWGKDPYIIKAELGIRGRMQTAMLREAVHLVNEGFAQVGDIDRACRNDAGTYLPFAGHFQYMDLMGTYAYGVVMEKLNKELSNTSQVPAFLEQIIKEDCTGMTGGKGFYDYTDREVAEWEAKMRAFGFDIRELMEKYD